MNITMPIFWFVMEDVGEPAIRGDWIRYDRKRYEALPHLYMILVIKGENEKRALVAGQFIKTSLKATEQGFADAVRESFERSPELAHTLEDRFAVKPILADVPGNAEPTELQLRTLILEKWLKFNTEGHA